jgi:hypothetical protein
VPPVDRNNPVRAKSSESQLAVLEFFKEFPDDETCLNYLWRSRFRLTANKRTVRAATASGRSSATRASAPGKSGMHLMHPRDFTDGRDDLREVVHVAPAVVLRHVHHVEHSMRGLDQAARARAWRDGRKAEAHDIRVALTPRSARPSLRWSSAAAKSGRSTFRAGTATRWRRAHADHRGVLLAGQNGIRGV